MTHDDLSGIPFPVSMEAFCQPATPSTQVQEFATQWVIHPILERVPRREAGQVWRPRLPKSAHKVRYIHRARVNGDVAYSKTLHGRTFEISNTSFLVWARKHEARPDAELAMEIVPCPL